MAQKTKSVSDSTINPTKINIRDLITNMTISQRWRLLGILGILLAITFFLGGIYYKYTVETDNLIDAIFIPNRVASFNTASSIVQRIAHSNSDTKNIINYRATINVPEQDSLYRTIFKEIKKGDVVYTRVTTYESDPDLTITRQFLEELGEMKNVRMIITVGSPYIPSCVITDTEALLGFKSQEEMINHSLYVKKPDRLVEDIRTMYLSFLENEGYAHEIKARDECIPANDIDRVIKEVQDNFKK